MVIARTPTERRPFVLPEERELPPEQQTTFWLRDLTAAESAQLKDLGMAYDQGSDSTMMRTGTSALRAVRAGLVGWDNFADEHGTPVEFATHRAAPLGRSIDAPNDATLDRIPLDVLLLLAGAITNTRLTLEDAGN